MDNNSLGKLIKEQQNVTASQHSAPSPEKLTRVTDFAHWEARCKDYLKADISTALTPSVVLDGLRKTIGSSEHPWVLQADFQRRYQQLGESINDFQQTFRLIGRRNFPTMDAKVLNTRVLEKLVTGVHDPQIRKSLLRDRPSTLVKPSYGSSPRQNNWRRPQTLRPNRPQACRTTEAMDAAPRPSDGEYYLYPDTVI
ncbi:unnamed protein product [Schistocephalus solidus]|uniref:Uncharacterized protein n=1 Tax=Schistocephalus solidus TaxID=70667 RepID=A0A183SAX2_SCHSO|nr:unnamed protein product [Schistocephalus solidus]